MSFSEGEAILQKILENTPYMGIYDEFPKKKKKSSQAPNQKMRNTQPNLKFL
jgi:hypothetical protein